MPRFSSNPRLQYHAAAWLFAGLTTILLFMSFGGDGYGAMGSGWLRAMYWSYILLAVGVVLMFWIFLPPRGAGVPNDGTQDAR